MANEREPDGAVIVPLAIAALMLIVSLVSQASFELLDQAYRVESSVHLSNVVPLRAATFTADTLFTTEIDEFINEHGLPQRYVCSIAPAPKRKTR